MQEIPLAMGRAFSELGGTIQLNHQLLRVEKRDTDYWLTFRKTWTSPCSDVTTFEGPGGGELITVAAKRVVVALPKSALKRVQFVDSSGRLQDRVDALCNAIASAPAMKYFASYASRWWETFAQDNHPDFPNDEPFNVGRVTGSNVVPNFFAWYPGVQQNADKPRPQCVDESMGVIQTYVTGFSDRTYEGLLRQQEQNQCKETDVEQCSKCFSDETGFVGPAADHVTKSLADMMRYQLAYTFGLDPIDDADKVPEATQIKYRIWSNDNPVTQTDSCHYFKSGHKWWKLYEEARFLDTGLHLIGEAFSFNWFWGEGAMETAEYMLQEVMGLKRPSWLSREEYCWAMPYWCLSPIAYSGSGEKKWHIS